METATPVDWQSDAYWRTRRLSPAQLFIHDIETNPRNANPYPRLGISEVLSSSLLPALRDKDRLRNAIHFEGLPTYGAERHLIRTLVGEYGWMNCLRSSGKEQFDGKTSNTTQCRWIHIASKFTEYLQGCLLALSDWNQDHSSILSSFRQLDYCISQNERFSKHGRYFTPFVQDLSADVKHATNWSSGDGPMLISVPFLDWTVNGPTPPLRFQVDPREGYQSSRTSSHLVRSILQHFYRLEDTSDREHHQVFNKHKPWTTDRELDLKVRRWYGHHPTGLNVDELWILVVDARHVVTFSSNQTWKSYWPPLQLPARIAQISFRGIRNHFYSNYERVSEYTAKNHVVACLSGAVGMLHRSFWMDIVLCLTDRYASYLSHLQYRLLRAPSTKLVMDLLQVQEELNIVIQITQQQLDLIAKVRLALDERRDVAFERSSVRSRPQSYASSSGLNPPDILAEPDTGPRRREHRSTALTDPVTQLLENLEREYVDLCDLRENSNNLVNRTIQLVNIRLEDHGKAILVFTIVTVIFLPLSFVATFFGMNVRDIRDMESTQSLFWIIAASVTAGVVVLTTCLAFYGSVIHERFVMWKQNRRQAAALVPRQTPPLEQTKAFMVREVVNLLRSGGDSGARQKA